jgi:hypothetical protein
MNLKIWHDLSTKGHTYFLLTAGKQDWLAPLIISGYVLITPLWVWIAKRNKYTHEVLYTGWTPVVIAMMISRSVNST